MRNPSAVSRPPLCCFFILMVCVCARPSDCIRKRLGVGAFSGVFLCDDAKYAGAPVALKIFQDVAGCREWANAEVQILKFLDSSVSPQRSFIQFYNHSQLQWKGRTWEAICYEALGPSLFDFASIHQTRDVPKGFPLECVRTILFQIALTLAVLHRAGIIHRDIKPENVVLKDRTAAAHFVGRRVEPVNLEVRLLDFGSASFECHSHISNLTLPTTPQYRPPEDLHGSEAWTKAGDMWGLGCLAVELWIGKALFDVYEDQEFEQLQLFESVLGRRVPVPANNRLVMHTRSVHPRPAPLPRLEELVQEYDLRRFIHRCMEYDTKERITALEALQHPFLAPVATTTLGQEALAPLKHFLKL